MSFDERRNSFHGAPAPDSGGVGVVEVGGGGGGQDHQPGRPLSPPRHRWSSAGPQMRPRKAEQDGEGLQKVHAQSSIPGLFLTASKTCEVYNENR